MKTPFIPIVDMEEVRRTAKELAPEKMKEEWGNDAQNDLTEEEYQERLENFEEDQVSMIVALKVASYLHEHKHKVYLRGHIRDGDHETHHYLIYAVDTEIDNFLINPFFSPFNTRALSNGAYWTKDDKYVHWASHVDNKMIRSENMENGYWVSLYAFKLEAIEVPAFYMESNTEKKHFLDKGEF